MLTCALTVVERTDFSMYTNVLCKGLTGNVLFCLLQDTMHLYALTLQKASAINHAIHGNFSGSKQQEIVISRGKIIELLRPDPNTGKVFPLLAMEMFGVIRELIAFRLTGGSKGKLQ